MKKRKIIENYVLPKKNYNTNLKALDHYFSIFKKNEQF